MRRRGLVRDSDQQQLIRRPVSHGGGRRAHESSGQGTANLLSISLRRIGASSGLLAAEWFVCWVRGSRSPGAKCGRFGYPSFIFEFHKGAMSIELLNKLTGI